MGIMDNFKQAVTELTGQEEQGGESKSFDQPSAQFQSSVQFQPKTLGKNLADQEDEDFSFFGGDTAAKVENNTKPQPAGRFSQALDVAVSKAPASSSGGTVIAAGTVIDGNISSNDDLVIYGVVNGDVLNANRLVIHGEVAGSISARDISLVDSIIAGNVEAQNSTEMTKDSCILGDLTTQNVVVSGKVKGNIEARGNGIFKRDSVVLGNVSVGTIVIEGGAKMRGFISTTDGDKEVDEDLFPKK